MRVIPNKYGATCTKCGQRVAPFKGQIIYVDNVPKIYHNECVSGMVNEVDIRPNVPVVSNTHMKVEYNNRHFDNTTPSQSTEQALENVDKLEQLVKAYADKYLDSIYPIINQTITDSGKLLTKQVLEKAMNLVDQTIAIIKESEKAITNKAIEAALQVVPVQHEIKVTTIQNGVLERLLQQKAGQGQVVLKGRPHRMFQKLINNVNLRFHTFLVGPAGSGKTTGASNAAMALDLRYFEASMGPATSQWDLFGFRNANGDFVPGVMYEPYLNGGVMMLDEMDNANANVLTSLNSALAGDGATFPCGYIKKHKDFVCIAAGNTFGKGADRMYVGRNQLDAASLDRFNRIPWDYDEDAEFDWAGRDQTDWVKLVQRIRKCVFDHAMRIVVSPRASIKGAVMLRNSLPVEDALDQLIKAGISKDDWTRIAQECRGMMVNGEGVLL